MARRCGCAGTSCGCVISGGSNVTVSGAGTAEQPYLINFSAVTVQVADTATLDLTRTGSGTALDPYIISGVVAPVSLGTPTNTIANVSAVAPTNGQVLGWNNATSTWGPVAPATATPGLINVGNSLVGDGSAGSPLNLRPDPAGRLVTGASGADLSADTKKRLVLSYANSAARTTGSTALGGAAPGMTAWMTDSATLTVYDGSGWRTITPEVGNSWRFPRISANYVDTNSGTSSVSGGTITGALPGRYKITGIARIQSNSGALIAAQEVVTIAGASFIQAAADASAQAVSQVVVDIYTHSGGNIVLALLVESGVNGINLYRDNSILLVEYLGR